MKKRIRRLMRLMRLMPIYQKPNTIKPAKGHKTYPFLLGGLRIDRPNQVWCADITYLPMRKRLLYLVAIIDWFIRKVLAWRISNTLEGRVLKQLCGYKDRRLQLARIVAFVAFNQTLKSFVFGNADRAGKCAPYR
jgi:transposase InsO family protein